MDVDERFLPAARAVLPADEAALLGALHEFTAHRLDAAARARERLADAMARGGADAAEGELHAFVRECWAALDGLAREVNLCVHALHPATAFAEPLAMTRQCTFYTVRQRLHEHAESLCGTAAPGCSEGETPSAHRRGRLCHILPVARLLWERTRERPDAAYERLSFLYNVGLFLPLRLVGEGCLPGAEDVPPWADALIRTGPTERCPALEGIKQIEGWLKDFVGECRAALVTALNRDGQD